MSRAETFPAAEWRRDYLLGPNMSADDADELLLAAWQEYSDDSRYYHGVTHPTWMLNELDKHLDAVNNPRVLGWQIIYHDKHMDFPAKAPGSNEELSAIAAEADLAGRLPGIEVDLTAHGIRATAHHWLEVDDDDLALFLDIDMAILGSSRTTYDSYATANRKEYGRFSIPAYCLGRISFLRTVAPDDVQIYSTAYGRDKWEAQAHANTSKELAHWQKVRDDFIEVGVLSDLVRV